MYAKYVKILDFEVNYFRNTIFQHSTYYKWVRNKLSTSQDNKVPRYQQNVSLCP